MEKIIIIGAGLSGLTIAYLLKKQNTPFLILEAQASPGGRVHTITGKSGVPIDLGATWFSEQHPQLLQLLEELGLEIFPQHTAGKAIFQTHSFQPPQIFDIPEGQESSYRLKGGTSALIKKMIQKIGSENIKTNIRITHIKDQGAYIELTDSTGATYSGKKVITTVPPQILRKTIQFDPLLPETLHTLLGQVQTWMSGSVKFALEYEKPFWREHGFSGTLFSQASLAAEVYDHSNAENTRHALMGFLNGSAVNYALPEREEMIRNQMTLLFGAIATAPLAYHEKIWDNEYVAIPDARTLLAHQNNGHPLLLKAYMENKFFLAGTETSEIHPGYLEGAVRSAYRVASNLTTS